MLGKLAELFLFGVTPLVLGGLMIPGAFAAEEIAISGEVSYRERIALPGFVEGVEIYAELLDRLAW